MTHPTTVVFVVLGGLVGAGLFQRSIVRLVRETFTTASDAIADAARWLDDRIATITAWMARAVAPDGAPTPALIVSRLGGGALLVGLLWVLIQADFMSLELTFRGLDHTPVSARRQAIGLLAATMIFSLFFGECIGLTHMLPIDHVGPIARRWMTIASFLGLLLLTGVIVGTGVFRAVAVRDEPVARDPSESQPASAASQGEQAGDEVSVAAKYSSLAVTLGTPCSFAVAMFLACTAIPTTLLIAVLAVVGAVALLCAALRAVLWALRNVMVWMMVATWMAVELVCRAGTVVVRPAIELGRGFLEMTRPAEGERAGWECVLARTLFGWVEDVEVPRGGVGQLTLLTGAPAAPTASVEDSYSPRDGEAAPVDTRPPAGSAAPSDSKSWDPYGMSAGPAGEQEE